MVCVHVSLQSIMCVTAEDNALMDERTLAINIIYKTHSQRVRCNRAGWNDGPFNLHGYSPNSPEDAIAIYLAS